MSDACSKRPVRFEGTVRRECVLPEEAVGFYRDLFAWQAQEWRRYQSLSLPPLASDNLPLGDAGFEVITSDTVQDALLPGLAPLIAIVRVVRPSFDADAFLSSNTVCLAGRMLTAVLAADESELGRLASELVIDIADCAFIAVNWMRPLQKHPAVQAHRVRGLRERRHCSAHGSYG